MMNLKTIRERHKGKFVKYIPSKKIGRIKSWNDRFIFVVFHCNDTWDDYEDYTGEGCNPSDLKLITKE